MLQNGVSQVSEVADNLKFIAGGQKQDTLEASPALLETAADEAYKSSQCSRHQRNRRANQHELEADDIGDVEFIDDYDAGLFNIDTNLQ